jgi:hypothetical protein
MYQYITHSLHDPERLGRLPTNALLVFASAKIASEAMIGVQLTWPIYRHGGHVTFVGNIPAMRRGRPEMCLMDFDLILNALLDPRETCKRLKAINFCSLLWNQHTSRHICLSCSTSALTWIQFEEHEMQQCNCEVHCRGGKKVSLRTFNRHALYRNKTSNFSPEFSAFMSMAAHQPVSH